MVVLLECPFCKLSDEQKELWNRELQQRARFTNKRKSTATVPTHCPNCGKHMVIEVEL